MVAWDKEMQRNNPSIDVVPEEKNPRARVNAAQIWSKGAASECPTTGSSAGGSVSHADFAGLARLSHII